MKRFHIIGENNEEMFDRDLFQKAVKEDSLITINSVSGGQTSAYIAANYPADYNVFALITVEDQNLKFKDEKVRQIVSDRIGREFIGTLEDDTIVYTILELEQFIGSRIDWVVGKTFEEVIKEKGDYLPNIMTRYCTTQMKLNPIFEWWYKTINEPFNMRIGFRANEQSRANRMIQKLNENGLLEIKYSVEKNARNQNKWDHFQWQRPVFPLIEDGIFKDNIVKYWKDKKVPFAWMNNCVGCFHRNEILLKKMFEKFPEKMEWFNQQEQKTKNTFRNGITYDKIKKHRLQFELFDDDFTDCDSGYCGL